MKNQVFQEKYQAPQNFYAQDRSLREAYARMFSPQSQNFMAKRWQETGAQAAGPMKQWSMQADQNPPHLHPRNFLGQDTYHIEFHPAYDKMLAVALNSGMFSVKWQPEHRARFALERHALGFSAGFLFAMTESGLYCPLCMTDGAALLLDRFAEAEDAARLLPGIWSENPSEFKSGAMFLTEKAGGSDVGANLVRAEASEQPLWYRLFGEKWFCSNANADIAFVLARTEAQRQGTKGLSIFLLEPKLPDGQPNVWRVFRLKDKLGVRSMASAECLFEGSLAKRIGPEFEGFGIMTEMINLSRMYNSVAAVAAHRHALLLAVDFLGQRQSFGKPALSHALLRRQLQGLFAEYYGNFYLLWLGIQLLDKAEQGQDEAAQQLRLLTPLLKRLTAAKAVHGIREAMEMMGGLGYIEDGIMPKLLRDSLVLPIWEGAGNIMILDMLRASLKSQGLNLWLKELGKICASHAIFSVETQRLSTSASKLAKLLEDRDALELAALDFFEDLSRLSQIAALMQVRNAENEAWVGPSLAWFEAELQGQRAELLGMQALQEMTAFDWPF